MYLVIYELQYGGGTTVQEFNTLDAAEEFSTKIIASLAGQDLIKVKIITGSIATVWSRD